MKILLQILLILVGVVPVYADDLCKFKDISFGVNKDEFYKQLDPKNTDDVDFYTGNNTMRYTNYTLGDRTVVLIFYFDDNNVFYKYDIDFDKYAANRIKDSVADDLSYISAIFEKKYGKAVKNFRLKTSDLVFKEAVHFHKKWGKSKCSGYTGITHYESQFNAFGTISHDQLFDAQYKRDKTKERKALDNASESL